MRIVLRFLFLVFLALGFVEAQNLVFYREQGRKAIEKRLFQTANKHFEKELLLAKQQKNTVLIAQSLIDLAEVQNHLHHPSEATKLSNNALQLIAAQNLDPLLFRVYTNLSIAHFEANETAEYTKYAAQAAKLLQKYSQRESLLGQEIFRYYANIGLYNMDTTLIHKGLKSKSSLYHKTILYLNLGAVNFYLKKINIAIKYTNIALKDSPNESLKIDALQNLATCQYELDAKKGLSELLKVKALREKLVAENSEYRDINFDLNLAYNLANFYFIQNRFIEAEKYYNEVWNKSTPQQKDIRGLVYYRRGRVQAAQKNWQQALTLYQTALTYYNEKFKGLDLLTNANSFDFVQDFENSYPYILQKKAQALDELYKHTKQPKYLEASLKTYQLVTQVNHYLRRHKPTGFVTDKIEYLEGFGVAVRLWQLTKQQAYIEAAFCIKEAAQASTMADQLDLANIKTEMVDEEDLKEELRIRKEIAKIWEQKDYLENEEIKNKLAEKKKELARFQKNIVLNIPEYYFKLADDASDVRTLQKAIKPNQAVIEYHFFEGSLYIFTLTNNLFDCKVQPCEAAQAALPYTLKKAIEDSKNDSPVARVRGESVINEVYAYERLANKCYDLLIAPIEPALVGKEEIIFVNHRLTHHVIFDVLRPNPSKKMLIERFTTFNDYSLRLFSVRPHRKSKSEKMYLGVAPASDPALAMASTERNQIDCGYLAYSKNQITNNLRTWKNGEMLMGAVAKKNAFVTKVEQFQFIDFSGHSYAPTKTEKLPFLVFADSTLNATEIQHLNLEQTAMVYANACHTASGNIDDFDGVQSIATALQLARAKSVIANLFMADDYSTSYISKRLNQYIQAGQNYATALRKAKLDFIAETNQRNHAYYWSYGVLIGANDSVNSMRHLTMLGVFLITVAIGFVNYRYFTKKTTAKKHGVFTII